MDAARKAAAAALSKMHGGAYSHLAAKAEIARSPLSAKDRSFANAIFYGAAERLNTLDCILEQFLAPKNCPISKLDADVRAILETGLYQTHYMRVPTSAAVNEAVSLARAFGKKSAAGLVNAVLRRAAEVSPQSLHFSNEQARVQTMFSVGPAVAECMMTEFPDDYEEILEASFSRPELCLRANTLKTTPEELVQKLSENGRHAICGKPPGCVEVQMPGGVEADPLFKQGFYHVQGASSQYLCANIAAAVRARAKPGAAPSILDLCAAPGGKSATLSQLLHGANITLCDKSENRLALAKELFTCLGIENARFLQNDAALFNGALGMFDTVLCDVPCSSLGVLAQKPDIRYTDGASFKALPNVQHAILSTAARYVQSGGLIFYSTCTIRSDENLHVVKQFLSENSSFRLLSPEIRPKSAIHEEQALTILPNKTGMDGFFIACLEKMW